jgi:hypothetical protein
MRHGEPKRLSFIMRPHRKRWDAYWKDKWRLGMMREKKSEARVLHPFLSLHFDSVVCFGHVHQSPKKGYVLLDFWNPNFPFFLLFYTHSSTSTTYLFILPLLTCLDRPTSLFFFVMAAD